MRKPGQGGGRRRVALTHVLTVFNTLHIVPHLALRALRAELHEIFHAQAQRELVLELVALVEEEHDRDVLQQVRLAHRLRTNERQRRPECNGSELMRRVWVVGSWVRRFVRRRNGRGIVGSGVIPRGQCVKRFECKEVFSQVSVVRSGEPAIGQTHLEQCHAVDLQVGSLVLFRPSHPPD